MWRRGPDWADLVAEWVDVDEWVHGSAPGVWHSRDWSVTERNCRIYNCRIFEIAYSGSWATMTLRDTSANQLPRAFGMLYEEPDFTSGSHVEYPDYPDDPSDYGL